MPRTGFVEPILHADHPHDSDSVVQREAEVVALAALSSAEGVILAPAKLELAPGVRVHVDGFHPGPPAVIAEVFARQGALKGGQRHKLMSDAFKLASVKAGIPGARVMLVLTSEVAKAGLCIGWRAAALKALGIEVRVVALPPELAERVVAAQKRQRMVNAGTAPVGNDEDEG